MVYSPVLWSMTFAPSFGSATSLNDPVRAFMINTSPFCSISASISPYFGGRASLTVLSCREIGTLSVECVRMCWRNWAALAKVRSGWASAGGSRFAG